MYCLEFWNMKFYKMFLVIMVDKTSNLYNWLFFELSIGDYQWSAFSISILILVYVT